MSILKRMGGILLSALLLLSLTVTAWAGQEPYTYRVTFHVGNQGRFVSDAIQVRGSDYSIQRTEESITVSGLHLGDRLIWDNDAVELLQGSRYYIRGVRLSGRDNSTVDATSFSVQEDRDYVVAYGVRGETVSYQVHYQDTNGKELRKSRTLQGNVGDKPVVAAAYIEGYVPQAYNLTGTLKADESKNVFTFVYRSAKSSGGSANANAKQNGTGGNGTGNTNQNGTGDNGTGNANQNGIGDNETGNTDNTGEQNQTGEQTQTAGQGDGTDTEEIPEIVDIDDEATPLASGRTTEIGNEANRVGLLLPAVAIISALAVICLTIWWRVSDKNKKKNK